MKDETVLYFARMKKADIPVSLRVYHGCFHGFQVTAVNSNVAMNAQRYLVESFQYAQKHYFAHNDAPLTEDDYDDPETEPLEEAPAEEDEALEAENAAEDDEALETENAAEEDEALEADNAAEEDEAEEAAAPETEQEEEAKT